jgi:hypothetical protein
MSQAGDIGRKCPNDVDCKLEVICQVDFAVHQFRCIVAGLLVLLDTT